MDKEEDQNQSFRVVDKRRFSESGDAVQAKNSFTDSEVSEETTSNVKTQAPTEAPQNNAQPESDDGQLDFPSFLVGMYSQTLIFLGEIPSPDTNLVSKNLEAAKQNIDILVILEEKTKGNLSQDEDNLIKEILNNLRLLFVKKL